MDEMWKLLVDGISSAFIILLGQLVLKFVFEPLEEYKKFIGIVRGIVAYNGRLYGLAGAAKDNAQLAEHINASSNDMRKIATELFEHYQALSFIRLLIWLRQVPKPVDIKLAVTKLNSLSSLLWHDDPFEHLEETREDLFAALKMKI